ncbi:F0F1 ATP synthase subunit gamma [Spiroplasma sp. TIUS-1]|uniref:ATP synthase F1 subunit gamma n=1 Tax=Spiroplasma sp. TIUS-1 TaxID=216963 RepID=UPI0013973EC0|nr:ATP synthase F1 subunit gamma [Spiroplasma sp. TIUS-1]QHX35608.1 F0F1 ATP synthase subunit gamma [Spiroplasma sp. TIUS-1]
MANLSELKSQIANTQDTNKITKAMEMVATSKFKKLSNRVLSMQDYIRDTYKLFVDIIANTSQSQYMCDEGFKPGKTLWILVGSNLGLCGGYNSNAIKLAKKHINKNDDFVVVGNKMRNFCRAENLNIVNEFLSVDEKFTIQDVTDGLTADLISAYNNETIQSIKIIYTKFINNVTFEETVLDILPIVKLKKPSSNSEVIFEPSASEILKSSISFYLSTIIFGSIMESQLSEQASRRQAMDNASKNGKDLVEELKSQFNRKRQENITQEITEIVAGSTAQQ